MRVSVSVSVAAALAGAGPAMPVAASAQLGSLPLPTVEYRSARKCQRALDRMQKAEEAIPAPPDREVKREGESLSIVVHLTNGISVRTRFFRCMGSTLTGTSGGVDGQTYPPNGNR